MVGGATALPIFITVKLVINLYNEVHLVFLELLVSYDSDKFPPQPIDRDEVLKLFQIKGKIEL